MRDDRGIRTQNRRLPVQVVFLRGKPTWPAFRGWNIRRTSRPSRSCVPEASPRCMFSPPSTGARTASSSPAAIPGDCHYIKGNYYARRRLALVKKLLEYLGLEPETVPDVLGVGGRGPEIHPGHQGFRQGTQAPRPQTKLRRDSIMVQDRRPQGGSERGFSREGRSSTSSATSGPPARGRPIPFF